MKKIIALILALLSVSMCFAACGEKADEGFHVDINVRDLPEEEGGQGVIFIKTSADFTVKSGTTLKDAVTALCTARGATFEVTTLGAFDSFTFDGSTIKAESKLIKEDEATGAKTFKPVEFKVTVNGTELKSAEIAGKVLVENDVVEIFLVEGEEFTAKE